MKKIFTTAPIEIEQKVYDALEAINADYGVMEHEPLYTADDLESLKDELPGHHAKNLFLRNAKGNKYYLLVTGDKKQINLKDFRAKIGSTALSFASEKRLMEVLKLLPGSVNPFSIINDENKVVQVFIDKELLDGKDLNFHPNVNYKTVTVKLEDLIEYYKYIDREFSEIEI